MLQAIVKAKSIDLIELKPADAHDKLRSLVKQDGNLVAIVVKWKELQEEVKKEGLSDKETSNRQVDKRRNSDLEKLKQLGGPFTHPDEVDRFVKSRLNVEAKSNRLYLEVRYARDTSLSLPKASPLFRLKENHKNLSIQIYCANLKTYLSKVTCTANVSLDDFDRAIGSLQSQ